MKANAEYRTKIDEEYGTTYKESLFDKDTLFKSFKAPSDVSSHRLQRRILIKILQAQLRRDDNDKDDNKEEVTFQWVIGGRSPAAGNGYLLNQTYGFII